MLKLRSATVVEVLDAPEWSGQDGGALAEQALVVELASPSGEAPERRRAVADVGLVGAAEVGDEVIVNVQALDLDLGSGGFDVVHANLSRGLSGDGEQLAPDGAMKLNYTSLQHVVAPWTTRGSSCPSGARWPCSRCTASSPHWRGPSPARPRDSVSGTCRPRAGRFPADTRAPFASCAGGGCLPAT